MKTECEKALRYYYQCRKDDTGYIGYSARNHWNHIIMRFGAGLVLATIANMRGKNK